MKMFTYVSYNLNNIVRTTAFTSVAINNSKSRFSKILQLLMGIFVFMAFTQQSTAQVAAWDFAGKAGTEVTVAAAPLDANLNASIISRGAGINPTGVTDTYAANGYTLSGTFSDAVTNGDYFQFTINAKPGYQASLSTLDANFRRSGTGPNMFQWQYSLDGFTTAGVNIGSAISYNLTTLNGDAQTPINLSSVIPLQNNSNATTVTVRLYGWGATNGSGTFALGRPGSPANDLAVGGNVSLMKVHNISIAKDYVTIQDAINDPLTLNTHIITADAGTYDEQVTVNKSVTIRGNNTGVAGNGSRLAESVLTGNSAAHSGFVITANNVTIDGFTVRECNGMYESGIYTGTAVSGTQIINNILTDNKTGIYPLGTGNTIAHNLFDGNNRPGPAGGTGLYTYSSTGIVIDDNEFKNHSLNAAILFDSYGPGAHTNATITKNYIHNNTSTGSAVYCAGINGLLVKENEITHTAGARAVKIAGGNSNVVVSYNNLNNNTRGIQISDDGFGANSNVQAHYNHLASNSTAGIQNDDVSAVNVTCNWYGNISGPAVGTNIGGTGSAISGAGAKVYANWLNYNTDASPGIGVQLPTAISAVPGSNTSAGVNHYRVLSNAVGCLVNNQTLTLSGTFNFGLSPAQAEWAKGNNQVAGDGQGAITGSGDDYSISAPDSVTGVTITASSLGSAIVQGPGDVAAVALESALFFNDNNATSSFQNWTISNILFRDFDVSVIQDVNGGNTTAYNGFKIINNQFDIPEDLNATFGGETTNFQNIGINLGFGSNQEISGNIFNVDGTGVSDDGAGKYSSTVILQSTTSGSAVYDGLKIKNNTVNVTGNPDPVAPSVIRGFWENGHNTNAAIEISGNIFTNTSGGNTANLNRQTAFWVTSRSGTAKKVEYKNNEVSRFKEGLAWMGGAYTAYTAPDYETGAFPVELKNNKFDATLNAVTVRKSVSSTNAGSPGYMENNSFTNFVPGGLAIKNEGTGDAQAVCNWYGTTSLPAIAALHSGPVYLNSYLNSGGDGAGTGFQPTGSCVFPPVHNETQNIYYSTIQSAIDAAATNDVIAVVAGTYTENVIVNKSVTLKGPNYAIAPCSATPRSPEAIVVPATNAVGSGEIFHVTASNVKIYGFTIDGDNTSLTSTVTNSIGADMNAAEGVTVYVDNVNNLDVQNNIFQNLSFFGVTLFGASYSAPSTAGHIISNNKFQHLGTYNDPESDPGLNINKWGGGVLLYNNQYAAVNNNCMNDIRLGVQTGNYSTANPGAAATVNNNTITNVRRTGIFHNLAYSTASAIGFSGNTITGTANVNETKWDGITFASLSVPSSATGNIITATAVTQPSSGIQVWNVKSTNPAAISGGSVTGATTGVFVNNYDGYSSDATDGAHATIGSITINTIAGGNGIRIFDNPLSASNSNVQAAIGAGVIINNGADGLVVENSTASVTSFGNVAFSGQTGDYIKLIDNANNINATTASFGGVTGAGASTAQNFGIEDKISHKIDNAALGFVLVKANNNFVTTNSFIAPFTTSALVQRAVDAGSPGFTVNVANGTYNGDVALNQANMILLGQSTSAVIRGLYAGATNSVRVSANGITVKDVTITRDYGISFNSNPGNDWASSVKTEGIIAENLTSLILDHIIVTGNRNGVYIHSVPGFIVRNSTISNNRTGFQIWGNLDNGQITNNFINNNFTHGLLVNFDQGPTTGNNLLINNNDMSGNWYSQFNFQNNGAPGFNTGSFSGFNANCNWYGSPFPVYDATNAGGAGYGAQNPSQFGGTDPNVDSDIRGQEAALITYVPYLQTGVDLGGNPNDGFQPASPCIAAPTRLYVNDSYVGSDVYTTATGSDATGQGTQSAPFATITRAIAGAQPGDTIYVDGGTYRENVVVNKNNLDFRGANYNINPNTGSRIPESIIQPAVNNAALDVISLNTAGHHTRINGFAIDGDNTALGGGSASLGADINAGYAIRATDNIAGDTITNNIIRNLGVMGISLSNASGTATSGNLISANKFTNILLSNGIGSYIGNNAYTTVTNNEMTAIRIGVQTGNFYNADPGNNHDLTLNNIQAQVLGIWTNLHYTNAANFAVSNNNFTLYPGDPTLQSAGVRVQSIQTNVGVTVSNNTVTGTKYGVILMNNPTSNTITVQGGTLTGNGAGVWATNTINGANNNAASSVYAVNGVSIQNSSYAGIQVNDTSATTNGSTVAVAISNNTIINNSTTGLLLQGGNASATFTGATPASFTGQAKYINQVTNGATVPATAIDATAVSFDGTTGAGASLAQNFAIEDKINHKIDNSALGFMLVKANNDYVTLNSFVTPNTAASIQRGVDAATAGFTVNVGPGTFTEDVDANKQVTLLGSGYTNTTIKGAIGNPQGSAVRIGAAGVIVDGFTITREGNNTTDWNNPALNTGGVTVQGQTVWGEIRNNFITGNRTGIDINNSNGNNIHNNIIDFNRTGLIFRNQTDNTNFQQNFVRDNWTAGIVFLDGSGGTNSPVQSAANSFFNNNHINGNWYGEVVERQAGGSLPAPGTNMKNFECNWWGATSAPTATTANSSEPGYAAQIPVAYGGSAVSPGTALDIYGPASANIDYNPWLTNGTDNDLAVVGFQPVPASCTGTPVIIVSAVPDPVTCGETTGSILVTFNGGTGPYNITWTGGSATGITSAYNITLLAIGTYNITITDANGSTATTSASVLDLPVTNTSNTTYFPTIQAAIDAGTTSNGHVIRVCGGRTYAENVVVNKSLSILGPNDAVNACSGTRMAEAVVVPAAAAIASGEIFHVAASNVTISGFTINGDNTAITSGFTSTNGADIDAAEGITVYETGVNNLTVTNNIIKNLSYFGVTLYDYPAGVPSSGHVISNNKIMDMGTYDAGSTIDFWGGGVLLYNNQYAVVDNNCMDNVRLGVQTGNFNLANPGAASVISNNVMTNVRRTGIFHNLHYQTASSIAVTGNTITGTSNVNETKWDGIALASLSVPSSATGNIITATAVTQPSRGIQVWNVKSTNPAAISGGSVTDATIGVFVNNYDGYNSDATDGAHAAISSITINSPATGTGIRLFDNPLATSNANVQASIGAGVIINNGDNGLLVENPTASVTAFGNVGFTGQALNYIKLTDNAGNISATTATFAGVTGGTATLVQNFAIEDKITHKIDDLSLGFVLVKANENFVTTNSFVSPATTVASVQRAVDAASAGFVVNIADGTYNGDVAINKSLTVDGQSTNAIIRGLYAGATKTVTVSASNVTVKDVTITRDYGATVADWYAAGTKTEGIIAENVSNLLLDHIIVRDNRNGVYIHSVPGFIVRNSTIRDNRTGFQIWGNLNNGQIINNFINNNFTHGVLVNFEQGPTTGVNLLINNNDISGNWYSQINFQNAPPMGTNVGSFAGFNANCNWYGSLFPAYDATNAGGVGYGSQVPSQFGGTDPGVNSDIRGQEAALITYQPYLQSGADAGGNPNDGFQPVGPCAAAPTNLYVNDNSTVGDTYTTAAGSDATGLGTASSPFATITRAIAGSQPGNTIYVDGGTYVENVVVNRSLTILGPNASIDPACSGVGRAPEAIVKPASIALESTPSTSGTIFRVGSPSGHINVTIKGFTIDGSNPALGAGRTLNGVAVHTGAGIVNSVGSFDANPGGYDVTMDVEYNIIKNLERYGVLVDNIPSRPAVTGTIVSHNKIDNLPSGTTFFGGGGRGRAIAFEENHYGTASFNCISRVNVGWQDDNYNLASPGAGTVVSNNTISSYHRGIFHNLQYQNATNATITNNTISAESSNNSGSDFGLELASIQSAVGATVTGNNVTGKKYGILLWNCPTSSTITVSGGTLTGNDVGIYATNDDPQFGASTGNSMYTVSGVSVTNSTSKGVWAKNAGSPGGTVSLMLNNTTVNATGSATGIAVEATSAGSANTATVYLSSGSIVSGGSTTPVSITGSQAQLYAGTSSITAPLTGANNAIQFSSITAANSRENLVLAGGTTIGMNANTAARAFASPQYSIVEIDAASGWAVPSTLAGGLHTVSIDGRIKFTNGILSTTAVTDTIEFGNNAADIMTGANPEKAGSYILGNAKMLSRAVNNGTVDMLGAKLAAEAGAPANVGNLVITRTTSTSGSIDPFFTGDNSIRTVWNIIPGNISASRTDVQYRYLNIGSNINGQNPASIYAYRHAGGVWTKISASLNSTLAGDVYTTSSFNAPGFSPWTLSSVSASSPDITPSVFMDVLSFTASDVNINRDFIVELDEIAGVATSGVIQFRITKPAAFNISFVPTSGISNVFGGVPNDNSDFSFVDAGGFYLVTTNASIGANGYKIAGFRISRKPGVPPNTTQNIGITIIPGSGGDSSNGNNLNSLQVTAN